MGNSSRYKMRPLTWVLLSFLFVLVLAMAVPKIVEIDQRLVEVATVLAALLMLIMGMILIRRLNHRLAALAEVAEMVGRGNYLVRSADESEDAVGTLSRAVNGMIDKIQASVDALENNHAELEESRKALEEQHSQLGLEYDRQSSFGSFLEQLNTVDINTIAENGLKYIMELNDALLGQFYLYQEDTLNLLAERGIDRQALSDLSLGGQGLPLEALRRSEWVVVEKLSGANLPKINLGFTQADLLTLVAAPMSFQGKPLGVLLLGFIDSFDAAKRMHTQTVLDAMGGSLNNAITYKTVQKQAFKLEQANQELLESDRLRSEFVANMSHELRTPLNSIIGFSAVMDKNRGGNLNDKDLNYVEKINRNGKHLLGLINDILDLSKIEAGRMDVELRACRLPDVIVETCEMLQSQADAKHIALDYQVPESLDRVTTDSDKLKQVLINLIGNAIKFTESGGVTVSLERNGTAVEIRVKDTGIGIPEDKLHTVFEPFRQADAGTTRKYGGTGLGLAISKSIVEMLGGQVGLNSEEGRGSEFYIILPNAFSSDDAPEISDTPIKPSISSVVVGDQGVMHRDLAGKVVLVIDDDPDARDLLSNYIGEHGATIISAANGEEGIRIAKEQHPDLITLDIMMPGIDGWKTLQTLKADPSVADIPVVVVSIVAEKQRAAVLGAVDAINKPVAQADLLNTLRRSLGSSTTQSIMVVDDDLEIWELYKDALQDYVGRIVFAQNGREALSKLESEQVDMIFLDLMMPEMDGLTFLRVLRTDKHLLNMPVVVVTAKQLSEAERRELELRVVDVVEKGEQMIEGRLLEVMNEAIKK